MRSIVFASWATLALALLLTSATAQSRWTQVGPDGGAGVRTLAVAPSDPDRVYATSRTQVLRSTDGGSAWRVASVEIPFVDIAVHPDDPETIAGIQGSRGGLRISRDGGTTWTAVSAPQDPDRALLGFDLVWPAADQLVAYQQDPVAGSVDLVISRDTGATWSTCPRPTDAPPAFLYASRHGRIVADYDRQLWASQDGCASWTPIEKPPSVGGAFLDGHWYGPTVRERWAAADEQLYRSLDGGATWTLVLDTMESIEDLAIDPEDPDRILVVARRTIWRSETRGDAWQPIVNENLPVRLPLTRSEIAFTADSVLALTRSGVERSTDDGGSWAPSTRGVTSARFERVRQHPTRPNELWAAGPGGLARSVDAGRTWRWLTAPFGEADAFGFSDVQIDPDTGVIYAIRQNWRMLASADDGASWSSDSLFPGFLGFTRVAIDPHVEDRVIVSSRPGLVVFDERGAQATMVSAADGFDEIVVDPSVPDRLVVAGERGIWVFDDLESPARLVLPIDSHEDGLAWSADAPDRLVTWHRGTRTFWRSNDLGETWTDIGGDLAEQVDWPVDSSADFVDSLKASPADADTLYAGVSAFDDRWLWRSRDGGVTWQPVDRELVGARHVAWSPDGGTIWAASLGDGLFRGDEGPLPACDAAAGLCLRSDRFEVVLDWFDAAGNDGRARGVPSEVDTSGLLWFFEQDNWELMVKILDGCALNQQLWVLSAATTDIGFRMRVEDRWTGQSRTYFNDPGEPAVARIDNQAFATCDAPPPEGADTSPPTAAAGDLGTTLELAGGRFRASVVWNTGGAADDARVAPLGTDDSGLFWFFDPTNWEMLVKVLDGCAINGHHWVLAGISSDVGYTLTVEDTTTGATRVFRHMAGTPAPARVEIEAFVCE